MGTHPLIPSQEGKLKQGLWAQCSYSS